MPFSDKQLEALDKIKEKSEDDYEKNLVYIAAGTLVLSMTFLDKIIKVDNASGVVFLILSWGLLALTLLGNLVSHQLSSAFHSECRLLYAACSVELPENASPDQVTIHNETEAKADARLDQCNRIMVQINWSTTISLFVGIAFLVTFCSINAWEASHKKQETLNNKNDMSKEIKPQTQNNDLSKGRTLSVPLKPATTQTGNSNNNGSSKPANNQSTNK
ncbi:hypothetical protein [Mucilaginibacter terrae]|uniref:Uncharacterized protein n=1 Tax=Mucilaginibacter terrae TaxID=1955052 RepID=A0ABU3GWX2_9SPHI|nr:hypothetical protein [Mucilaginibacter terrae]MDT3404266.1 hypothetical protein [Mucilaginibacter terrae]